MLYQALTGRLPIDGAPLEIMMRKQKRRPPRRVVGAPDDLSQLCVALLSVDPAGRPTGSDVLRMLAAPSEERPVDTPFVGRTAELGVLDRALSEVTGGATVAISVEGESGIGKTFKGIDGVIDTLSRALNKIDLSELALPAGSELTALAQTFPVLLRVSAIAREAAPLPTNIETVRADTALDLARIAIIERDLPSARRRSRCAHHGGCRRRAAALRHRRSASIRAHLRDLAGEGFLE